MSALAYIALARGYAVTGSDLRPNDITSKLVSAGARIFEGHDPGNVPRNADIVVKSTCIPPGNSELVKAGELGITIVPRAEFLKETVASADMSIGITGTHGKTTTSALIAHIMEFCGKDPTVMIGGELDSFGGNARYGSEKMMVAEVDESDGLFRTMKVTYAVLTNIEREHMEHHGTMDSLVTSYKEFIKRISSDGIMVYNGEDLLLREVSSVRVQGKVDFGISEAGVYKYSAKGLVSAGSIRFHLIVNGKELGVMTSSLIGRYNAMNILGAVALSMELGLGFDEVSRAVSGFGCVKRRFDVVGRVGSIAVVEDYAHHPTELKAVILAAVNYNKKGRVIVVFQPHRYSRTHDLAEEFSHCFYGADVVVLTGIYSADEEPLNGRGLKDIVRGMDKDRFHLIRIVEKNEIPEYISGIVQEEDIVLILGAGDILDVSLPLLSAIRGKRGEE